MGESSSSKWITSIGGTILLGLATSFIYDWIKEKPILTTVSSIFTSIWKFLIQILRAELKVWWVVLALTLYLVGKKIMSDYRRSITPELPEKYKSYVRESFTNWNWKWVWKWDGNRKEWDIKNLWPYCKKCDIELLNKSDLLYHVWQCPRCCKSYEYNNRETDDYDSVKAVIKNNIARNRDKL